MCAAARATPNPNPIPPPPPPPPPPPNQVRRSSGDTPLHAAAEMGRVGCAKALLAAGAKHDALNHREEAPLDLCTRPFTLFGSEAGKREIVKLLVEAGASGSG